MEKCEICGAEFATAMQLESHWAGHAVRPVKTSPLSYLLCLPDGITPGRYEAAEAFADAYVELSQMHLDRRFNFFPFSYKTDDGGKNPALNAVLAIEESPKSAQGKTTDVSRLADHDDKPLLEMLIEDFFTKERLLSSGFASGIAVRACNGVKNANLSRKTGEHIWADNKPMRLFLERFPNRRSLGQLGTNVGEKTRDAIASVIIAAGLPFG
jgi:hypothetical protein